MIAKCTQGYDFSRKIYRLREKKMFNRIFDDPENLEQVAKFNTGRINGIEVMIEFSEKKSTTLYARTEAELSSTYNRILDILSGKISNQNS